MTKFKALLGSRRFWAGIAGMVVILADTFFGEGTVNPVREEPGDLETTVEDVRVGGLRGANSGRERSDVL